MKTITRLSLIFSVAILFCLFRYFYFESYLTLESLKSEYAMFQIYLGENPTRGAIIYFLLYVLVSAASVPGVLVMTVAGGVFFGFLKGVLLVSWASPIGATIAFLLSRFIFREIVKEKFSDKLKKMDARIKREGAYYLFTLRLIPAFPFFILNPAMGLTQMRVFTFFWVSQLGMLPSTLAFVAAGSEVSKLNSASDLLSWQLVALFILIGIFPLALKKGIQRLKYKRSQSQRPAFDKAL